MGERDNTLRKKLEITDQNTLEVAVLSGNGLHLVALVNKICAVTNASKEEASKAIYSVVSDGKGRLLDPSPPTNFISFLFSFYSVWFWSISGIMASLVVFIFILPSIYPFIYFRYILGVFFVFFVPGWAFVQAFFPNNGEVERYEKITIAMGVSLSITPLIVLSLNYIFNGLNYNYSLLILIVVTFSLSLFGLFRKYFFWKTQIRQG